MLATASARSIRLARSAQLGAGLPVSLATDIDGARTLDRDDDSSGMLTVGGAAGLLAGLAVAALVGGLPIEVMPGVVAGVMVLVGIAVSPSVGLYALLAAIPFSPTFGIEDAAFSISAFEPLAALLLLFWLARGAVRREIELPRGGLFGALFGLLVVLLISGGQAWSFPLAIKETLKWVLLVVAFIVTSACVRGERAVRGLLAALFFAGAGQALMGVVQSAAGYGPPTFAIGGFMRAHGNFGQPNPFPVYLGTILPLAVMMATLRHPGRLRTITAGSAALIGLGIVLSQSRGAWLGLMISFAIMALVWGPRTRRLVVPTVAAAATFVILALMGVLPPILANRVTSVTSNFGIFDVRQVELTPENFAVVERMAHWQAGWEMFVDEPLLGVGPGNYPAVYERYYIRPWREPLGHAHNYYLNMAAEAGLPGLFALLVVLFLAFRTLLRRYWAIGGPAMVHHDGLRHDELRGSSRPRAPGAALSRPFARALAVGLLGSLVMFCTHNLFDNLLVHGVGIQIGILLGLIGGVSTR